MPRIFDPEAYFDSFVKMTSKIHEKPRQDEFDPQWDKQKFGTKWYLPDRLVKFSELHEAPASRNIKSSNRPGVVVLEPFKGKNPKTLWCPMSHQLHGENTKVIIYGCPSDDAEFGWIYVLFSQWVKPGRLNGPGLKLPEATYQKFLDVYNKWMIEQEPKLNSQAKL